MFAFPSGASHALVAFSHIIHERDSVLSVMIPRRETLRRLSDIVKDIDAVVSVSMKETDAVV